MLIQSQRPLPSSEDRVPFLHRDPSIDSSLPYLTNILANDVIDVECWSILARVKLEERWRLVNPGSPVDKEVEV